MRDADELWNRACDPFAPFTHPGDAALGSGLQAERERHGLVVVQHQRRQGGAGRELVPAVDPALGLDGIAQFAQPVDVAPQRPDRHLEPTGELGPRPVAVRLQQRQQAQHPNARGGHAPSLLDLRTGTGTCPS